MNLFEWSNTYASKKDSLQNDTLGELRMKKTNGTDTRVMLACQKHDR